MVGHHDVVLGNLTAEIVPGLSGLGLSTLKCGVNFSASRRQLCNTEAGHRTRDGFRSFLYCSCSQVSHTGV